MASTSADVAREAGVSRGAVSQILNGHGDRFADATRDRVLAAAAKLDYQPSLAGRALARGTSDVVVAVIPNTTFGEHLQDMLDELTSVLAGEGLTVVAHFSTSDAGRFERYLAAQRPAAVVALASLPARLVDVLRSSRVAVATRAGDNARPGDPNTAIGAIQAHHLTGRGYRRLAYARLREARENVYGDARLDGFRTACAEVGLDNAPVIDLALDDPRILDALVAAGAPGLAVACYNDDLGMTLVSHATAAGWRVPDDLAVIGVDDVLLSRALIPQLTTIGYDSRAAARGLAAMTLRAVGRDYSGSTDVDFRVIERATT